MIRMTSLCLITAGCAFVSPRANASLILEDPWIFGQIAISGSVLGTGSGDVFPGSGSPSDYANRYSGPDTVTATYIVHYDIDSNGQVQLFDDSIVKFTDSKNKWSTSVIKITSATISDHSVASLSFSDTDWYPNAASNHIRNDGLGGFLRILGGDSPELDLSASYKWPNDAILTFTFSGTDQISSWSNWQETLPEPPASAILLTGLGVAALLRIRMVSQRRKATV